MKRESIAEKAERLGLYLTYWSPGDGRPRVYRLHQSAADFNDGTEVCTLYGLKDVHTWLNGYGWALELQRRGGKL